MDVSGPAKKFRRIAKPVMEKRRRDRINHSLETLRLLLSENTDNEKLRSPKVEKAEILESVVNFFRAEQAELQSRSKGRKRAREEDTDHLTHKRQMYNDGMRACLLTVSHFITSKTQELEGGLEWKRSHNHLAPQHPATMAMAPHDPRTLSTKPLSRPGSPAAHLSAATAQYGPQEIKATYLPTKDSAASQKPSLVFSDCVWRPWPQ
ncbi:hairy-related 5 [Alosa sapidissima]|uniref:hairy-related 5 n=1 Tax=Alosa sapidissima TaxID=34773 RepID=UPI001C09D397|nr:hairy-related 5 [Alosa sapidissima]